MIADYKFYHGVVLAELINYMPNPLTINELIEEGRLSSYILDESVGLQIKHCANKLNPWHFTFTKSNLVQLLSLREKYQSVFIAFVCHDDGIVSLTLDEAISILSGSESEQAWIRIDRRRHELYRVAGGACELPSKKPQGVQPIVQALLDNR